MFDPKIIDAFKADLDKSSSVLILLPPTPDRLLVSSGIGLFSSLEKAGKEVQIGCADLNQTDLSKIKGVDNIKSSIGTQNLIISFQFKEENLDKVDYDIDDQGNFRLMIKPKSGSLPPDTKKINYTYSGANADLVIVMGISSLEELGKLYSDEKQFLDQATIASLSKNSRPASFATHNFHTNSATSIAEITSFLLLQTKIKPDETAANRLLGDIYSTTNNLNTPRVTAETFETIAFLVRNGAKPAAPARLSEATPSSLPPMPTAPMFGQPSLEQIPPAPIPPDWKRPKIFRSSPASK